MLPAYPKVITVAQRKGGVGKTTIARYVAEYFARYAGKRVLSVDLDNQCNLSMLLLEMDEIGDRISPPIHKEYDPSDTSWAGRGSSADIYLTGDIFPYDVTRPVARPGWDIVPGDAKKLYELDRSEDPRIRKHTMDLLRDNLATVAEDYDVIIIDTGPGTNGLMLSAVRAATHVLIPFAPEPQCGKGLGEMLGLIRRENEYRRSRIPEVTLLGILPNKVRKNLLVQKGILDSMAEHAQYSKFLIPHRIPDRAVFQEMDSTTPVPESVFDIVKSEHLELKSTMEQLGDWIHTRVFGDGQ